VSLGPVIAGVVGAQKPLYDIWGNTVNVASRMDYTGIPGRIQVPEDCAVALRAEKVSCTFREEIDVKGKGRMRVYHVDLDDHGLPVIIDPNDAALAEDYEKDLNRTTMSQLRMDLEDRRYSSSSIATEEEEGEEGEKTESKPPSESGGLLGGGHILRAASRRLRKFSRLDLHSPTAKANTQTASADDNEGSVTSSVVSSASNLRMLVTGAQKTLTGTGLRRSSVVNPDAKPNIKPIMPRSKWRQKELLPSYTYSNLLMIIINLITKLLHQVAH